MFHACISTHASHKCCPAGTAWQEWSEVVCAAQGNPSGQCHLLPHGCGRHEHQEIIYSSKPPLHGLASGSRNHSTSPHQTLWRSFTSWLAQINTPGAGSRHLLDCNRNLGMAEWVHTAWQFCFRLCLACVHVGAQNTCKERRAQAASVIH